MVSAELSGTFKALSVDFRDGSFFLFGFTVDRGFEFWDVTGFAE